MLTPTVFKLGREVGPDLKMTPGDIESSVQRSQWFLGPKASPINDNWMSGSYVLKLSSVVVCD